MPHLRDEPGRAVALLLRGLSQSEVARHMGVVQSTIIRLHQRLRKTGRLADRPRRGVDVREKQRYCNIGQYVSHIFVNDSHQPLKQHRLLLAVTPVRPTNIMWGISYEKLKSGPEDLTLGSLWHKGDVKCAWIGYDYFSNATNQISQTDCK